MRIGSIHNASEADIKACSFNILLGISLENKLFGKKYLSNMISWMVAYSEAKAAVLFTEPLHAINLVGKP